MTDAEKQVMAEVEAIAREVEIAQAVFMAVITKARDRLDELHRGAIVADTRAATGVGVAPPQTWSSAKN